MNHEGFTRIEGFTKGMKGSTRRYNFVIETNDHILFPQLKKLNFDDFRERYFFSWAQKKEDFTESVSYIFHAHTFPFSRM